MPKIKDSTRALRRQQIIAAATECLVDRGLANTTVAEIAAHAGLATASIYTHFPSKQILVASVARSGMLDRVAELDRAGTPYAPAELAARLVTGAATRRPHVGVLLQLIGESSRDEELRDALAQAQAEVLQPMFRRSAEHWATGRLGPAQSAVWAERMTPVLLALVFGFFAQITVFPHFDPRGYAATISDIINGALRA